MIGSGGQVWQASGSETKKGARRPLKNAFFNAPASLFRRHKLRVGLKATFRQVDALVLLLFADANPHRHLEDAPDHQAGDKYPCKDDNRAYELTEEGCLCVRQENCENTPQSNNAMYGNGADGIVDTELVERDNAEDHNDAANRTNRCRQQWRRIGWLRSDGNQTGQGAVQR